MHRGIGILCVLILLLAGMVPLSSREVQAAVVKGTTAGFVTESPVDDPTGSVTPMDDYIAGMKDTAPAGATKVVEIGWWCSIAQGEANFEVGIYSHDSGDDEPDELLAGVSRTNAKGETSGWKKVTGLDISITAETIYWIAVQLDDAAGADPKIDYSSDAGERYAYQGSRTTLTSPYDGAVGDDLIFAVYAVYETDGAPAGQVIIIGARNEETYHNPRFGIPPVIWE